MKVLLDTQLLLWVASEPERLSPQAGAIIDLPDNELQFSVASLWEIAIKTSLGRSDFQVDAAVLRRGLLDNGYGEVAITAAHVFALAGLAAVHKDPFDRMLVAQASADGLTLVTSDRIVGRYSPNIIVV